MRLRGGGYIGAVVAPSLSAAPGVWSLADVYAARKAGSWPPVVVDTTELFGDFDTGTIDTDLSSVTDPDTDAPGVQLYNRNTGKVVETSSSFTFERWSAKLTGVRGKTPEFSITIKDASTECQIGTPTASYRPWWSYDQISWTRFSNIAMSGDTDGDPPRIMSFDHNSPFAQDTVYVCGGAGFPTWLVTQKLAALASDPLVFSTASWDGVSSAGAEKFKIGQTTTVDDEQGRAIPALPLYGFRVSSGAGNAPDGVPKRKAVLIAGLHPTEQESQWYLWGAVNHLLSGSANAVAALERFDFYVYPCVNPAGVYSGFWRSDPHYPGFNSNRFWRADQTGLECADLMRPLILADVGGECTAFIDCHMDVGSYGVGYLNNAGTLMSDRWEAALTAALASHSLPTSVSDFPAAVNTYAMSWGYNTLFADLAVTSEHGLVSMNSQAYMATYGECLVDTLRSMFDDQYFAPVVLSLFPANNAVDVSAGTGLAVDFDRPMQFGSAVAIGLYKADDTLVEAWDEADIGSTLTVSSGVLTITRTVPLDEMVSYYLKIDQGSLESRNGTPFAGISDETSWTFTTAEAPALDFMPLDFVDDAVDRTVYTFSGKTTGTPAADRWLVGFAAIRTAGSVNFSSIVVDGVAAQFLGAAAVNTTSGDTTRVQAFKVDLTANANSSGNIVVTCSGASTKCSIWWGQTFGGEPQLFDEDADLAATGLVLSTAVDVDEDGVALTAAYIPGSAGSTISWSLANTLGGGFLDGTTYTGMAWQASLAAQTGLAVTATKSSGSLFTTTAMKTISLSL